MVIEPSLQNFMPQGEQQMCYIEKSDYISKKLKSVSTPSTTSSKGSNSLNSTLKTKYTFEKQQIVLSRAVIKGKGDRVDSDLNLPIDINDSTVSGGEGCYSASGRKSIDQPPFLDNQIKEEEENDVAEFSDQIE